MFCYEFEIIYNKGKKTIVAGAVLRRDEDVKALLYANCVIQLDWIIEAREE